MAILTLVVTVGTWIFLLVHRSDIEAGCQEGVEQMESSGYTLGSEIADMCSRGMQGLLIGGGVGVFIGNIISVSGMWINYMKAVIHNRKIGRLNVGCNSSTLLVSYQLMLPVSSEAISIFPCVILKTFLSRLTRLLTKIDASHCMYIPFLYVFFFSSLSLYPCHYLDLFLSSFICISSRYSL